MLRIHLMPGQFAVCKLDPGAAIPGWAGGLICSITRTPEELSIVCNADAVPAQIQCEAGWRALQVQGPLPFGLTGILESIARPLAEAEISIFAVSTFDTDYVLVKEDNVERAIHALRHAGHEVVSGDMIP